MSGAIYMRLTALFSMNQSSTITYVGVPGTPSSGMCTQGYYKE